MKETIKISEAVKRFEELLREDGIQPDIFENLHDVCDPNAYAVDVLQLEVDQDTIPVYNQFADAWNDYVTGSDRQI